MTDIVGHCFCYDLIDVIYVYQHINVTLPPPSISNIDTVRHYTFLYYYRESGNKRRTERRNGLIRSSDLDCMCLHTISNAP